MLVSSQTHLARPVAFLRCLLIASDIDERLPKAARGQVPMISKSGLSFDTNKLITWSGAARDKANLYFDWRDALRFCPALKVDLFLCASRESNETARVALPRIDST